MPGIAGIKLQDAPGVSRSGRVLCVAALAVVFAPAASAARHPDPGKITERKAPHVVHPCPGTITEYHARTAV